MCEEVVMKMMHQMLGKRVRPTVLYQDDHYFEVKKRFVVEEEKLNRSTVAQDFRKFDEKAVKMISHRLKKEDTETYEEGSSTATS